MYQSSVVLKSLYLKCNENGRSHTHTYSTLTLYTALLSWEGAGHSNSVGMATTGLHRHFSSKPTPPWASKRRRGVGGKVLHDARVCVPVVSTHARSHRAASSPVNWFSGAGTGSQECRARRHTLTRPCHERVLHGSYLSGVCGSFLVRFHLRVCGGGSVQQNKRGVSFRWKYETVG